MAEITKNLLPKSIEGEETQPAAPNRWVRLDMEGQFIDSIDTSGGELSDAARFNLLVSSVPSPWSRVHLTTHAFWRELKDGDTRTLMQFYQFMRSEWRGLVAAFVLYPDYFELTDPIELVSTPINERNGKFDIVSVFAEMLFDDAALWKHQRGGQDTPKLQLLFYRNGTDRQLVGATSPFTIFFTGVNYSIDKDDERIYWVKDGKFQDPIDSAYEIYYKQGEAKFNNGRHLDNLKKLYSFLTSVQANRRSYVELLEGIWDSEHAGAEASGSPTSRCRFLDDKLNAAIGLWLSDLRTLLGRLLSTGEAAEAALLPVNIEKKPAGPLARLLQVKSVYYWWNNTFYTSSIGDASQQQIDDIERLFIDSDMLAIWRDNAQPFTTSEGSIAETMEYDYRLSPVYFLEVKEDGQAWFVALPLSDYALDEVFKAETESIIEGKNPAVVLKAEKHGNKIDVFLKAKLNGDREKDWVIIRQRTYGTENIKQNKKVFVWPNFCSEKWTKYYYYSEFPVNAPDVQMVPVFEGMEPVENLEHSRVDKDVYSHLVKYPSGTATNNDHVYEIMRTNKPLRRIMVRKLGSTPVSLGCLVVRRTDSKPASGEPQAMLRITRELKPATVGFDFGSANSCSYYQKQGQQEIYPVPFANHRLAVIGFDNRPRELADPDELLFVSNEEPINENGQIKSWLHEHDEKFTNQNLMDEELVGGVPVNETNIRVKSMDSYEIMTNAGRLRHNMKWLIDDVGKRRKKAFMKMVWVHICADLFEEGVFPEELNWSYPSAMGSSDMEALSDIFEGLPSPTPDYPVKTKNSYTEAEAVCSFFLGKKVALSNENMFLGIDIGGSTSDILILGRKNGSTQAAPTATQATSAATQQPADLSQPSMKPFTLPDTPYYAVIAGQQAGPFTAQQLLSMKAGGQLTEQTLLFKTGLSNWTPAGQLPELAVIFTAVPPLPGTGIPPVPGAGIPPVPGAGPGMPPPVLPVVSYYVAAGGQPTGPFDAQQLLGMKNSEQLTPQTQVWKQGMAAWTPVEAVAELAFLCDTPAGMPPLANGASGEGSRQSGDNEPRLFTQCSVRMAAGVFFDAVIKSKKFRDCIRRFHDSRQTRINVEGIEKMGSDPDLAPYYLNNIFDQLHGDIDFKKFYSALRSDVPFVFTLPAYITGALLCYAGMLMRNTILKQNLRDVKEVHMRYFGKGGRLFEWLFFAFPAAKVDAYLNACFEVGLKNDAINARFNRSQDNEIICKFDNASDVNFGRSENSENKSEVASGLVAQNKKIVGIEANRRIVFGKRRANAPVEYDARKQEVVGEIGIRRNGRLIDELDNVDDNFYENEGAFVMPTEFRNFNDFIDVFTQFVGQASNIYPNAVELVNGARDVTNVNSFIINDSEYRKYMSNVANGKEDSYRMPVFVASALYYLKEVLLTEVFKN